MISHDHVIEAAVQISHRLWGHDEVNPLAARQVQAGWCSTGSCKVIGACLARASASAAFRIYSFDLPAISCAVYMATQSRHDSTGAASAGRDDDNVDTSTYECNICYDVATEPVVTMCGHLYCWPCLYRYASYSCITYCACTRSCSA